MAKQLFLGLITEGTTDVRFLKSVVARTFQDIAFRECPQDVEVYVFDIRVSKIGLTFGDYVLQSSKEGVKNLGIMALAVHVDADKETVESRMNSHFLPVTEMLHEKGEDYCKIITPIIPVRMIEAWMLSDTQLLKEEIGTKKTDHELGLDRPPESIADPKSTIEEAISKAYSDAPKKRREISIADLYSYIGDALEIAKMERLSSYRSFQDEVRATLRSLHYLQ